MAYKIEGALAQTYPNKYVIQVARTDGRHLPSYRVYTASYDNPRLAHSMSYWFCIMNTLIQQKHLTRHIRDYNRPKEYNGK